MTIDRYTLNFPLSQSKVAAKWCLWDLILIPFLVVCNALVYKFEPFQRQFIINDIALSHPYTERQRVDDIQLFTYSLGIPFITILVTCTLFAHSSHRWYLLYMSCLGLSMSFIVTCLFSNFIKNWIGRCRPDFIARCQPSPDALPNTLYTAQEICQAADKARIFEGYRTTPSGHSSESFAGLAYLHYWLSAQLITFNREIALFRVLIAWSPILVAVLIALSRTQDYRHHFVDVVIGSALGWVIARWAYSWYFTDDHFSPKLDDSDVPLPEEELGYDRLSLPTSSSNF